MNSAFASTPLSVDQLEARCSPALLSGLSHAIILPPPPPPRRANRW
ncbi:MAG TPA: hypothetical protein VMZ71_11330 [Gemmataceae bacterium]|nr:hypothetical protein [Gemmataceae bacterium]